MRHYFLIDIIIAIWICVYGKTKVCTPAYKFIPKRHKINTNNGIVRKDYSTPLNLTKKGTLRNKFWLRNVLNYIFFENTRTKNTDVW